jgi:hypothetical protein
MPTALAFAIALTGIAVAAAIGSWLSGPVDRWFDKLAALRVARRQMRQNDERGTIPKDSPAL